MRPISLRTWLYGTILGLASALILSLSASNASCVSSQPGDACSEHYQLNLGQVSVIDGYASSANSAVYLARLPIVGSLTYDDFKLAETQARKLINENRVFREDISPHLGKPNFDAMVRQFDINGGFTAIYTDTVLGQITLQDRIDRAVLELRQARDIYAFLAVYADTARFRTDGDYANIQPGADRPLCPSPPPGDDPLTGNVDWCDFPARMRQSVREAAYLRMIFGQQFTVDAMGLHFDAGELIGGEAFVVDEVNKLQMAVGQYELAQSVVSEGFDLALGSGCFVADFYTQSEWALLSRATEGKERAQHHIAVRMSYLDAYGPTKAQGIYQSSAMEQYITLIGTAGQSVGRSPGQGCTAPGATRPDGDMVAKMAADMLDTREKSRQMQEGRNIFGFDVQFTPARPYRTAVGSNDIGLWDEAWSAAQLAKTWQSDETQASRQFDQNIDQLQNAILGVKGNYDSRLLDLTGCNRNDFSSDEEYFACVDNIAITLQQCDFQSEQVVYDQCVAQAPTGLLRQGWDNLRTAYLHIRRVKQSLDNIPQKIDIEVGRNATVNHAVETNGKEQSAFDYSLALIESINVSVSYPFGVGVSYNPASKSIAETRGTARRRQVIAEISVNNANSESVVRNLLLEEAELEIDLSVSAQEANAQLAQFQTLAAETKDTAIEARRARAYLQQSPANDPSFRLVRDSARLRLASQLEYAARVSYMAAKRAEYEYAARLSASNFRISDIYRARTADDILRFLNNLDAVTNNLIVQDSAIQQEDFKVSVALHLLGLTDENLGLTGEAARTERIRRFRLWVAENTYLGTDGKPVLAFSFSTSVATNGIFSNVVLQGYDRFWLHEMSGIGQPKAANTGLGVNLVSAQSGNLRYRRVIVTEAGLLHLRSFSGCVFEYRLISPAALLGLEWPSNQNPEWATADFKASINNAGGERTPAFLARPVSATDWQVEVRAGAPELGLNDMNLQLLTDIELFFSTTRGSRTPGEPEPQDCIRIDW